MNVSKILGIILILLSILFLGLQYLGRELDAFGVKAIGMCLLVVLYLVSVKRKNTLFLLFLVTYSVAEVHSFLMYETLPANYDMRYVIGNTLYILAYLFLILRILFLINLRRVFYKFPIQIVLLVVLGVFVVYMVTDLSEAEFLYDYTHFVELLYNTVVMFLVCLALVNYMYNDTKKSMNLLVGSICIIFSEVTQIAYYYISNLDNALNVTYSVFLVGAFVFFYIQATVTDELHPRYESHSGVKA